MLLTSALLDRMHNNFLTLEVWSKTGGTHEDEVCVVVILTIFYPATEVPQASIYNLCASQE